MHVIASMPGVVALAGALPAWGQDLIVPLLILLVGLVLGIGFTLLALLAHAAHRAPRPRRRGLWSTEPGGQRAHGSSWLVAALPPRWLAVRAVDPRLVQAALNLHHAMPCSWEDGVALAQERKLFISPSVGGWVLVVGADLPDPADDVDKCYVFLTQLSRKVGVVQFFGASRVLNHHAWAWAERGGIVRAYAWAGTTVWNQGRMTPAERELGLTCYDYAASVEPCPFGQPDPISRNTERVAQLAARWSLNPGVLDLRRLREMPGIVGELARSRIS